MVSEDLFDERLDSVRSRVVEIEIQRRTRELGVRAYALDSVLTTVLWSFFKELSLIPPLQFKDVDSGGRVQFTIDKGDGPVL